MIEYLLVLHLCSNIDGDCVWQRSGHFATQESCVEEGLAVEAARGQFKCVMQAVQEPPPIVPPLQPKDQ